MKLNVVGFEITEGNSKKDGKPYSIGKLHTILPLSANAKQGNAAKGCMGKEFRCEVGVLRKIEHLHPPFIVDAETAEVMRFGELSQDIVKLTPIDRPPSPSSSTTVAARAA